MTSLSRPWWCMSETAFVAEVLRKVFTFACKTGGSQEKDTFRFTLLRNSSVSVLFTAVLGARSR